MTVYLVPAGRERHELYSEAPDELPEATAETDGFLRRWAQKASVKWHELVDTARRGGAVGRFARGRDAFICRLAESIAEQRTLWGLRLLTSATMRFPSRLDAAAARTILDTSLARSRTHHGRWLIIDTVLFALSGVFFFVPGPNLIAYYFAFRMIGHLQSWRGAKQAIEKVVWKLEPDQGLDELASLVDVPRVARAPRVAAIAQRLNLPRLTAFFDRVAVPTS